jgi:hypothetical protein
MEPPRWDLDGIFDELASLSKRFAEIALPNTLAESVYQAVESLQS